MSVDSDIINYMSLYFKNFSFILFLLIDPQQNGRMVRMMLHHKGLRGPELDGGHAGNAQMFREP